MQQQRALGLDFFLSFFLTSNDNISDDHVLRSWFLFVTLVGYDLLILLSYSFDIYK